MEALLTVKGGLLETNTAVFGSTAVNESTVKMFTAVNGSLLTIKGGLLETNTAVNGSTVDHKRWSFRDNFVHPMQPAWCGAEFM